MYLQCILCKCICNALYANVSAMDSMQMIAYLQFPCKRFCNVFYANASAMYSMQIYLQFYANASVMYSMQLYANVSAMYVSLHRRRHPWKTLKDTMCIRQSCKWDSDCCYRWNICDKSAKVCTNCWYGHPCLSEKDCCYDFPYCQRKWKLDENGQRTSVESGRCADQRLN